MTKNVLIVGKGGREHALGWKLSQSPHVTNLFFAPGNPGTKQIGENVPIEQDDIQGLVNWAKQNKIDLTVVGPELPLSLGIVDAFTDAKLPIFGPTQKAAQLETSKAWATDFMKRHGIPRPASQTFTDPNEAREFIESVSFDIVVKASGLASGKGVIVPQSKEEALAAVEEIMVNKAFGDAGSELVIQEKLNGQEISVLALCDGKTAVPLLPAQDHKPVYDGDSGPNTGGMGVYAPTPFTTETEMNFIHQSIITRTMDGLKKEDIHYKGVLYAGLMVTDRGPKVLEYNVRFGDPETQPLMMLLDSDLYTILESSITGTLKKKDVVFKEESAVCVIVAAEGYPRNYKKGTPIHGLDTIEKESVQVFHSGTSEKDGTIVTDGGRVLGVTATGATLEDARTDAYTVIGKGGVHFDGMHYRTDIGQKALKGKK